MASTDPPSGRDREVLAGLPNARPTRRSAKRDRPARGQRAGGAAAAPAKAGAKGAPRSTAKQAAPPSTAKTGAARSTAKTRAARSAAKQAAPRSTAKQAAPRSTAKTGARRSAAPIPPAGYATPHADEDGPKGADLVTTVVQAAGELAHIGISAGGRALKSALQRLPRP